MNDYNKLYSEIEKILKVRRQNAQNSVNFLQERLFKNPEYLRTFNEYNSVRFEISKAKYLQDETLIKTLEEKEKLLIKSLKAIRKEYGLTDKDFTPKYECQLCSDTGRLEDGKRCKCFKKLLSQLTFETLGFENPISSEISRARTFAPFSDNT